MRRPHSGGSLGWALSSSARSGTPCGRALGAGRAPVGGRGGGGRCRRRPAPTAGRNRKQRGQASLGGGAGAREARDPVRPGVGLTGCQPAPRPHRLPGSPCGRGAEGHPLSRPRPRPPIGPFSACRSATPPPRPLIGPRAADSLPLVQGGPPPRLHWPAPRGEPSPAGRSLAVPAGVCRRRRPRPSRPVLPSRLLRSQGFPSPRLSLPCAAGAGAPSGCTRTARPRRTLGPRVQRCPLAPPCPVLRLASLRSSLSSLSRRRRKPSRGFLSVSSGWGSRRAPLSPPRPAVPPRLSHGDRPPS